MGAGLIIQSKDWNSLLTSYIPALATLVAAFYGAKFAFEFQNKKDIELAKKINVSSVNKTIFNLSRMANSLFVYQRDFINPVRNKPGIFLELRPIPEMNTESIQITPESLHFILDTDFRNLASEILIEEERFKTALNVINLRSILHLQEVQPLMERAGFTSGTTIIITAAEIEKILGNRICSMIKESTNEVIFHVDSTIESIKEISEKLKNSIKTIYPDEPIIAFVLPESKTK